MHPEIVSAMGDSTDELIDLAEQVSPLPAPRELDMLLTAGERISMALLGMAITSLGHDARSFTGSQAGVITDGALTVDPGLRPLGDGDAGGLRGSPGAGWPTPAWAPETQGHQSTG